MVVLALALLAAACSSSGDDDAAPATTAPPAATGSGSTGGLVGLLAACPAEDRVEDPPASAEPATAVLVDDPSVEGIGDPALPDLGDPALDVTGYDLSLSVDPSTAGIDAAVARLRIEVLAPTEEVRLDLVGLDVGGVVVDGTVVDARREGAKLVVPLPGGLAPGEVAEVTVCYSGDPVAVSSPAIFSAPVGWNPATGGTFVLSEPEGARTWYPVNDHPTDKAPYRFTVTVPRGQVVVANGALVAGPIACTGDVPPGSPPGTGDDEPCAETGDEGGGAGATSTFVWEMAEPMAPYLATVVIGDLQRRALDPVGDVPVEVWLPRDADPTTVEALEGSSAAIAFLEDVLGPYPFAAYGGVVVPGAAEAPILDGVALETQAMSIFGADAALPSVVVHEAAHQWIGDAVTVERWASDLWYVEGFATYAEWLLVEERSGEVEYRGFVESAEDSLVAEVDPIGDLDPEALFTPVPYQGGALVFHALRRAIGDEAFFTFLRTFVDRYSGGNASTDDLVATASEVAGEDLAPLVDAWLGPPSARPPAPA